MGEDREVQLAIDDVRKTTAENEKKQIEREGTTATDRGCIRPDEGGPGPGAREIILPGRIIDGEAEGTPVPPRATRRGKENAAQIAREENVTIVAGPGITSRTVRNTPSKDEAPLGHVSNSSHIALIS